MFLISLICPMIPIAATSSVKSEFAAMFNINLFVRLLSDI